MKFARMMLLGASAISLTLAAGCTPQAQDNAELIALQDRIAIEDMMFQLYAEITDYDGARETIGSHYTEDGVMDVNGIVMNGRDEIQAAYSGRRNEDVDPSETFVMLLGNPRIVVDGDSATLNGIWTGVVNPDLNTQPQIMEQGTETTELVKVDGTWLIKSRLITSLSNVPDAWNPDAE